MKGLPGTVYGRRTTIDHTKVGKGQYGVIIVLRPPIYFAHGVLRTLSTLHKWFSGGLIAGISLKENVIFRTS